MGIRAGNRGPAARLGAALRLAGALAFVACVLASGTLSATARPPLRPSEAVAEASDPALLLRRALEARERGERALASRLLAEVARRHPVIGDHADQLRAQLAIEDGDTAAAVGICLEALQTHADSPLRSDLYELLGDARALFEDEEGARSAWRAALEETRDGERELDLMERIAGSQERSGETAAAAASWLEIWVGGALDARERRAVKRLDALESALRAPVRDAGAWRRRADRLLRKRRNEAALEAYDRALAAGTLPASEARRARQQRAHTLFRLRRYPEAVEAFAALPQDSEVRLWHARSLARADRVFESIEAFDALAEDARGTIAVRSRYLAAILREGRGLHEPARAGFERVASMGRHAGLANAALWRLGWADYRAGQWDSAAQRLGRLASRDDDAIGRLRALYWQARAVENAGRPESGALFTELATEFPLTYYGWRASRRVEARPLAAAEREAPRPGRSALGDAELARPRILLSAGLDDRAREEMRRLKRRARGLAERLELAQLFADAGDFNGAQRVVLDGYHETLARGPQPSFEEMWWLAWPAAYAELVSEATDAPDSVDPELVFSIMREESGYRPSVISISGARGLLQIMESTGARLARDTGRTGFHADDLFQPETNIGLGSHYLSELSGRFPDRLSAAIASYNAGPSAVGRWVASDPQRVDDEWVESIPYDQTRTYVKRVLRSLFAYRILY